MDCPNQKVLCAVRMVKGLHLTATARARLCCPGSESSSLTHTEEGLCMKLPQGDCRQELAQTIPFSAIINLYKAAIMPTVILEIMVGRMVSIVRSNIIVWI